MFVGVYPALAVFDNVIFAKSSHGSVAHPPFARPGACETNSCGSSTRSLGDARSKTGKAVQVLALDCAGDSGTISNIRTSCSERCEVISLLRQCSGIRANSIVSAQFLNGLDPPGYLVKGLVGFDQEGAFEEAAFTTVEIPCREEFTESTDAPSRQCRL